MIQRSLSRRTILATVLMVMFLHASLAWSQNRGAPPTARSTAGLDLTGYWVPVINEDWIYRMMTPRKGDYDSVPMTPEGRRVADTWDPAKDTASGNQCKAYGAAALMRLPGRIRIAWENDQTLSIDAEAGTRKRLFSFGSPRVPGPERTWQGSSLAQWVNSGAPGAQVSPRGYLKVVTTNLRAGYLRKNGVPYSESAVLTEYYNRTDEPNGDTWLIVTTMVDDPLYLTQRFVTSTHFRKLPANDTKWVPEPCTAN